MKLLSSMLEDVYANLGTKRVESVLLNFSRSNFSKSMKISHHLNKKFPLLKFRYIAEENHFGSNIHREAVLKFLKISS